MPSVNLLFVFCWMTGPTASLVALLYRRSLPPNWSRTQGKPSFCFYTQPFLFCIFTLKWHFTLCFHLSYTRTKLCAALTTEKCTLWHFHNQARHQLACYRWCKFPACTYLCLYCVVLVVHATICTAYLDRGPQTFWCDPVETFQQVPAPIYPSNYYVFNLRAQAVSVCQLLFENGCYDGTYYTCVCILFRCCDVFSLHF